MDRFHHHIIPNAGYLIVCKIPDASNSGGHQPVPHLLGSGDGHCQQAYAHLVFPQKGLQGIRMIDRHPSDSGPHHPLIYVKSGQKLKAVAGKFKIFYDSPA